MVTLIDSTVICTASLFFWTVMNDIVTTMFNKKFLEELFKPQELYSKKALRTVFDRLAHASIMRLNQASMDKVSHWVYTQSSRFHSLLYHLFSFLYFFSSNQSMLHVVLWTIKSIY